METQTQTQKLSFEKAKTLIEDIQEVLTYKDAVQTIMDFILWELKPEEIRTFSIHYKLWSDEKETENPWDIIITSRLSKFGIKPVFYWAEVEVNTIVVPILVDTTLKYLTIHKDYIEISDQSKLLTPPETHPIPAFEISPEVAKELIDYFNEP